MGTDRGNVSRPLVIAATIVLLMMAGCADDSEVSSRRLLLFGVDAATWDVLTPMIEAGELPVMASLIERGSSGILRSGEPVQSPQMWTSIATGMVPEKHGILGFMAEIPESGKEVPVTSNMRRVKAFWNMASEAGISVGIVGWWPSWPAEEVNGFMIAQRAWPMNWSRHGIPYGVTRDRTGRLIVEDFEGRTYPEELYGSFVPYIYTEEDIQGEELSSLFSGSSFSDPGRQFHARWVYAKDKTFAEAGLNFLEEYDPDVFAVYLQGTDVVSHYYWGYQTEEGFDVEPAEERMYGRVVRNYYAYVDKVIGTYLDEFGEDATVLIVSDHGFETKLDLKEKWERGEPIKTKEGGKKVPWDHGMDGVIIMSGPGIRRGNQVEGCSVVDVTPTILAYLGLPVGEDMDGRPIDGIFEETFLEAHPVQFVPTHETAGTRGSQDPMESPMDDGIKEKLRSLGYIE